KLIAPQAAGDQQKELLHYQWTHKFAHEVYRLAATPELYNSVSERRVPFPLRASLRETEFDRLADFSRKPCSHCPDLEWPEFDPAKTVRHPYFESHKNGDS